MLLEIFDVDLYKDGAWISDETFYAYGNAHEYAVEALETCVADKAVIKDFHDEKLFELYPDGRAQWYD